jgi:hypothetical protein
METTTSEAGPTPDADSKSRAAYLRDLVRAADVSGDAGWVSAATMALVDAAISGDAAAASEGRIALVRLAARATEAQHLMQDKDPQEAAAISWTVGAATAIVELATWVQERTASSAAAEHIRLEADQHAGRFLITVGLRPGLNSGQLVDVLRTDKTQVSRTGGALAVQQLVDKRRFGRIVTWELSPKGDATLKHLLADKDARRIRKQLRSRIDKAGLLEDVGEDALDEPASEASPHAHERVLNAIRRVGESLRPEAELGSFEVEGQVHEVAAETFGVFAKVLTVDEVPSEFDRFSVDFVGSHGQVIVEVKGATGGQHRLSLPKKAAPAAGEVEDLLKMRMHDAFGERVVSK